jgi:hypothetical protein
MNERTNERARVSSEYSPPLMDRRVGLSLSRERGWRWTLSDNPMFRPKLIGITIGMLYSFWFPLFSLLFVVYKYDKKREGIFLLILTEKRGHIYYI